jgi:hypothetical protein
MIDVKQSFRKGKLICVVDVDPEHPELEGAITRKETVYKSINQAKKANRKTMYRVIKAGAK